VHVLLSYIRSPSDTRVLVRNGELLMGCITKRVVGASAGSLIHVIYKEHGPEICRLFFDYTQKLVNNWLIIGGHSMSKLGYITTLHVFLNWWVAGISDIVVPEDLSRTIAEKLEDSKKKVSRIIEDAVLEKLRPTPGNNFRQVFLLLSLAFGAYARYAFL
jgi:DNA-directed RNA polymerase II subunit RPB1